MGEHWMFLTVCGCLLIGTVGTAIWFIYGKLVAVTSKYRCRYAVLPTTNQLADTSPPPYSVSRLGVPRLFRNVSYKKDEEAGGITETSYELFSRRDD